MTDSICGDAEINIFSEGYTPNEAERITGLSQFQQRDYRNKRGILPKQTGWARYDGVDLLQLHWLKKAADAGYSLVDAVSVFPLIGLVMVRGAITQTYAREGAEAVPEVGSLSDMPAKSADHPMIDGIHAMRARIREQGKSRANTILNAYVDWLSAREAGTGGLHEPFRMEVWLRAEVVTFTTHRRLAPCWPHELGLANAAEGVPDDETFLFLFKAFQAGREIAERAYVAGRPLLDKMELQKLIPNAGWTGVGGFGVADESE